MKNHGNRVSQAAYPGAHIFAHHFWFFQMAGVVGKSGRKPEPDRTMKAEGDPVKPSFDSPLAEAFWDEYVPDLIDMGVVAHVDTPRLAHLCEVWSCLRLAYLKCKDNPVDRASRMAYLGYSAEFARLSSKFGLTPVDRKGIKADKGLPKSNIIPRQR